LSARSWAAIFVDFPEEIILRVAVIGGGLQGAGIALELSLRGASVDVFEKRNACITQASFHNEGKIHLGFVYAKDSTLATARLMVDGALQFESTLKRWLERDLSGCPTSSPFCYLVHRDSLLDPEQLSAYYRAVSGMVEAAAKGRGASYFGQDPRTPVRQLNASQMAGTFDAGLIKAVFQTPEVAIDPESIAGLLSDRLTADRRIRLRTNTTVTGVRRESDSVTLAAQGPEGALLEEFDHVVNASWEDLLSIDASAGVDPSGAWSFRVKHFLRLRGSQGGVHTPSATVVLGPFGDVVRYRHDEIFLSWYPVGRLGISSDLKPPAWPIPVGEPTATRVRSGIFDALLALMPGLQHLHTNIGASDVNGGIIYALGNTDVNDPESRLHERYSVGPRSFGRYHTVNTGKYTLAPMFARQTADRIMGSSYAQ
jgi:glycine/D-amino acid oxidase-like deaminating enzyme